MKLFMFSIGLLLLSCTPEGDKKSKTEAEAGEISKLKEGVLINSLKSDLPLSGYEIKVNYGYKTRHLVSGFDIDFSKEIKLKDNWKEGITIKRLGHENQSERQLPIPSPFSDGSFNKFAAQSIRYEDSYKNYFESTNTLLVESGSGTVEISNSIFVELLEARVLKGRVLRIHHKDFSSLGNGEYFVDLDLKQMIENEEDKMQFFFSRLKFDFNGDGQVDDEDVLLNSNAERFFSKNFVLKTQNVILNEKEWSSRIWMNTAFHTYLSNPDVLGRIISFMGKNVTLAEVRAKIDDILYKSRFVERRERLDIAKIVSYKLEGHRTDTKFIPLDDDSVKNVIESKFLRGTLGHYPYLSNPTYPFPGGEGPLVVDTSHERNSFMNKEYFPMGKNLFKKDINIPLYIVSGEEIPFNIKELLSKILRTRKEIVFQRVRSQFGREVEIEDQDDNSIKIENNTLKSTLHPGIVKIMRYRVEHPPLGLEFYVNIILQSAEKSLRQAKSYAVSPNEDSLSSKDVAILVNGNDPLSKRIASYYMRARSIPRSNIILVKFDPRYEANDFNNEPFKHFRGSGWPTTHEKRFYLTFQEFKNIFGSVRPNDNIKFLVTTFRFPTLVDCGEGISLHYALSHGLQLRDSCLGPGIHTAKANFVTFSLFGGLAYKNKNDGRIHYHKQGSKFYKDESYSLDIDESFSLSKNLIQRSVESDGTYPEQNMYIYNSADINTLGVNYVNSVTKKQNEGSATLDKSGWTISDHLRYPAALLNYYLFLDREAEKLFLNSENYKHFSETPSNKQNWGDSCRVNHLSNEKDVLLYAFDHQFVCEFSSNEFYPGSVFFSLSSYHASFGTSEPQATAEQFLGFNHSCRDDICRQKTGVTGFYGNVIEPTPSYRRFPDRAEFIYAYFSGSSMGQAYAKSVDDFTYGAFFGDPLAAPFKTSSFASDYKNFRLKRNLTFGKAYMAYGHDGVNKKPVLGPIVVDKLTHIEMTMDHLGYEKYTLEEIQLDKN
jgi:hypothetical protein